MNTPLHSSHEDGVGRNTGGRIVRVLATTKGKLHRAARLAMDNPTRRSLLKVLATHDKGVTYRTLFKTLPVSERWVRELVADLRRDGIVEVEGNPALIQFTSEKVMLAVKEVLAFLASDWADAVTSPGSSRTALSTAAGAGAVEDYLKEMHRLFRGRRWTS